MRSKEAINTMDDILGFFQRGNIHSDFLSVQVDICNMRRTVIGEAIKAKRNNLGYTQEHVVDIIGYEDISLATLTRIEKGEENVSVEKLLLVIHALQMNPEEYMIPEELYFCQKPSMPLRKHIEAERILLPIDV